MHVFIDGYVEEGGPDRHTARGRGYDVWLVQQSDGTERDVQRSARSTYAFEPGRGEGLFFKAGRGIARDLREAIAEHKTEPDWMRKFGISRSILLSRPLPHVRKPELHRLENIYTHPPDRGQRTLGDLPARSRQRGPAGIPSEKKYLAGVGAPYESRSVPQSPDDPEAGRALPDMLGGAITMIS